MRRPLSVALAALALGLAGCQIPRPVIDFKQEVWTPLKTDVKDRFSALQFIDANTGYVLGENGMILKTGDGGATWSPIYPVAVAGKKLVGLHFLNALQGYAISDASLYQTEDGAATWKEVRNFQALHKDSPRAVKFVTANAGFVVGGNGVYQTLDGVEWTKVAVDQASAVAQAGATVFVAGNFVYRTNLTGVYEGVPASGAICQGGSCGAGMSFPTPTDGWLFAGSGDLGNGTNPSWVLRRTRDGGSTWTDGDPQGQLRKLMTNFGGKAPKVAFATADRGWVILGGDFAATNDGGQTWARQKQFLQPDRFQEWTMEDPTGGIVDISVVDAGHAWIAASEGRIFKYENKHFPPWIDDNGLQLGGWRCCP